MQIANRKSQIANPHQPSIANRQSKIANPPPGLQSKIGNRKSKIANPDRPPIANRKSKIKNPQYSIRKHIAFWSLTFNGQEACFDHEQGAYYVAYLLLNPPDEPIHGMALELKSMAYFGQFRTGGAETEIVNPSTGATMILACDAIFEQRNFALDDADSIRPLRRKQLELEAILDNEDASEPVKAEVRGELLELYEWQRKRPAEIVDEAQKAVRTVRMAIQRLQRNLANAIDPNGRPHPVLRPFAEHLEKYMLVPSKRYSSAGRGRTKTGVAGRFTYEAPVPMRWIG